MQKTKDSNSTASEDDIVIIKPEDRDRIWKRWREGASTKRLTEEFDIPINEMYPLLKMIQKERTEKTEVKSHEKKTNI